MDEIKETLQRGFSREAQAYLLYFYFAHKAEEEISLDKSAVTVSLLKEAASLFRDLAEQERYHALSYLKALDGVGDTVQNLQGAIENEKLDSATYSEAAAKARAMGQEHIADNFERIASVEKRHAAQCQEILQRLQGILLNERLGKY